MAGNFDMTVDTLDAVAKIKGDAERLKHRSIKIVEEAAKEAAHTMRLFVPRSQAGKPGSIYSRISWDRAEYHPGGEGGGGYWVANAGVRGVANRQNPEYDPALLVYYGTGLFGPRRHLIEGKSIGRKRAGNILVFEDGGKTIFTHHVKGQPPQRIWVISAQRRANAVVASRIAMIDSRRP